MYRKDWGGDYAKIKTTNETDQKTETAIVVSKEEDEDVITIKLVSKEEDEDVITIKTERSLEPFRKVFQYFLFKNLANFKTYTGVTSHFNSCEVSFKVLYQNVFHVFGIIILVLQQVPKWVYVQAAGKPPPTFEEIKQDHNIMHSYQDDIAPYQEGKLDYYIIVKNEIPHANDTKKYHEAIDKIEEANNRCIRKAKEAEDKKKKKEAKKYRDRIKNLNLQKIKPDPPKQTYERLLQIHDDRTWKLTEISQSVVKPTIDMSKPDAEKFAQMSEHIQEFNDKRDKKKHMDYPIPPLNHDNGEALTLDEMAAWLNDGHSRSDPKEKFVRKHLRELLKPFDKEIPEDVDKDYKKLVKHLMDHLKPEASSSPCASFSSTTTVEIPKIAEEYRKMKAETPKLKYALDDKKESRVKHNKKTKKKIEEHIKKLKKLTKPVDDLLRKSAEASTTYTFILTAPPGHCLENDVGILTPENSQEYSRKMIMVNTKMFHEKQLEAFRNGFYEIIPQGNMKITIILKVLYV